MAVRKQVVSFNWNNQGRLHVNVVVVMHSGRKGERKGRREKEKQAGKGSGEILSSRGMPRIILGLFIYSQCSVKEHVSFLTETA